MKKIILVTFLLSLSTLSFAQQKEPDYKTYKTCTDCFDHWEKSKTGLESYGFTQDKKTDHPVRKVVREVFGGIAAIFVGVAVYTVYNKANQTANEIH